MEAGLIRYEAATADDAEDLVAIRIAAMRESLERLGRFDLQRARDRFLAGFEPALTRHVVAAGARVGFVVVRPHVVACCSTTCTSCRRPRAVASARP